MTVSTHVLDTERGRPATGVRVELYDADGELVGDGVTNDDGRIAELGGSHAGTYRIVFHPATDRKSTRLNSSHLRLSRMPSSA